MFKLDGKRFLVTGATGGIGRSIVSDIVASGGIVCATGTNEEKLSKLEDDFSGSVKTVVCNLSDEEQVMNLVGKTKELMEGIDGLVHNAGITRDKLLIRMKNEDWDEVMSVNLRSAFILNREMCKSLMKNGFGRVVNISSVVGVAGNPGQANYVASKSGMIGMTKSIAIEMAKRNITVNCIAPGFIDTPMTSSLTDQQKEGILSAIPAGFMGNPEDISGTVVFLLSSESRYITGQVLHVNGGMLMV